MRVADVFAGIGGFSLGLERAGMTVAHQVEIDDFCQRVLAKHWPDVPKWGDIRDYIRWIIHEQRAGRAIGIDLVCGGFPCQDISTAGRGAGLAGARSGLWWCMYRAIRLLRPDWLLIENVPALKSRGYDVVADALERAGYTVWPVVVGAWAVGAPHKRDRVWIIGRLADSERIGIRCGGLGSARSETRGISGEVGKQWFRVDAEPGDQVARSGALDHAQPARLEGHGPDQRPAGQREAEAGSTAEAGAFPGWPAGPTEQQYEWEQPRLADATIFEAWSARLAREAPDHGDAVGAVGTATDGLPVALGGLWDHDGDSGMDRDCLIMRALEKGQIEVDCSTGRIFSRRIRGREGERVELQGSNCNGYRVHKLVVDGVRKMARAHRIVWMSANGPIPEGEMIDHINRRKTDNRLANLRLVDARGNRQNFPEGFGPPSVKGVSVNKGSSNHFSKLAEIDAATIAIRFSEGESASDLATEYGLSRQHVYKIANGTVWPEAQRLVRRWNREALKAAGNAVVPQIPQMIGDWIKQADGQHR